MVPPFVLFATAVSNAPSAVRGVDLSRPPAHRVPVLFFIGMEDTPKSTQVQWSSAPSAKSRTSVQKSVTALLDALAPERVQERLGRSTARIEQHRTPTGCVLQAADAALSVSWFAENTKDAAFGELHVLVWKGTLTRRGMSRTPRQATMVSEMVLLPIEPRTDDFAWLASDGQRFDNASLAAHCVSLLEREIGDAE